MLSKFWRWLLCDRLGKHDLGGKVYRSRTTSGYPLVQACPRCGTKLVCEEGGWWHVDGTERRGKDDTDR